MSTIPAHPDNYARLVSLGYVLSRDRQRVLMMFHDSDPENDSYGKYNGYTSPILPRESAYESFCRTVEEQSGLQVQQARFRGSIHWPDFPKVGENTFAQVFLCTRYSGVEYGRVQGLGENRWVQLEEIARGDLPMWEGDRKFFNLVFNLHNLVPFHGYMPYERGTPRDWFHQMA